MVSCLEGVSVDVAGAIELLPSRLTRVLAEPVPGDLEDFFRKINRVRSLERGRDRYVPGSKIGAEVCFIGAEDSEVLDGEEWKPYIAGAVNCEEVRGDHFSFLQGAGVEEVVRLLLADL